MTFTIAFSVIFYYSVAADQVQKYREIVYRTGKEKPLIFDPHKRVRKDRARVLSDIPKEVAQSIKASVHTPFSKVSHDPGERFSLQEQAKTFSNAHQRNHDDYDKPVEILSPESPSPHQGAGLPQSELNNPTESLPTCDVVGRELSNSAPNQEVPGNVMSMIEEQPRTPTASRKLVVNIESKPPAFPEESQVLYSGPVMNDNLEGRFAPWGPPPYNLVPIFPSSKKKSTEKKDIPATLPPKSNRATVSRSRPETVQSGVSETSRHKPFPTSPPSPSPSKSNKATAKRSKPTGVEFQVLEKSQPKQIPVIVPPKMSNDRAIVYLSKPVYVEPEALKTSHSGQPSVHDATSTSRAAPEPHDPNTNSAHSDSSKQIGTASQKRSEGITSRKASKSGSDANKTVTITTTNKDSAKSVAPKKPKREINKRYSFHFRKVWGNPRPHKKLKKPGVSAALFGGDAHSRPPSDYKVKPDFFPPVHLEEHRKSGLSERKKSEGSDHQQENQPEILMEETEPEECAENEREILKDGADNKAEDATPAATVTKQTVAQRQKSHIFQIASRSPSPNKRRRPTTAPHDDAIHIGLGSSFWELPNSPPIQWYPVEIIEQIRIRSVYFSDLPEDPVPFFRYPRNVEEAHFDGSITQQNFSYLVSDLLELHTLQLHLSSLHYLNFDRPSVNSLDLPLLKSLEISSTGFTEEDTTIFNMKHILHNIISILRNCTFPSLIYLSVSAPLDVEHERKFTEALWQSVLLHRSTLEVINIECPFPNMEPRHNGQRRFFPGVNPDITSMDISGAKDLNLVSFHLFFFTRMGSTEFWRRVLKTQEILEYIQFWVEGQEYYKFPYDIVNNNCSQLQTLSLNVDIRSFADPYSKVPIDFNVFKDTPQLRVLALKGFLMEHVHPKYYLKTDIINVEGLPKAMETLKIMNLNVDKDDLRLLAMENKSLKVLYLDNVGTEGNLGISLDVIVNLLKRSKSSSLESLEIFDGINEASLYGRSYDNTEDKGFRLIAQLLLKKGLKPSLRAYRTPDSDFEIIYEDDSNVNSENGDFNLESSSKYDSWAERELKTKSSHHGVGTKRLVIANLFQESSSTLKKKKSMVRSKQQTGRVGGVDGSTSIKKHGDLSVNHIYKNEYLTNSSSSHTVGGRRSSFSTNKGSRRRLRSSRRKTKPS